MSKESILGKAKIKGFPIYRNGAFLTALDDVIISWEVNSTLFHADSRDPTPVSLCCHTPDLSQQAHQQVPWSLWKTVTGEGRGSFLPYRGCIRNIIKWTSSPMEKDYRKVLDMTRNFRSGTLTQAGCTQGQSPNPLWLLHCYLSLEAGFSKGHWPPGGSFCLRPEKTLWRAKKFLPPLPVLKIVSHGARSVGTVWAMSSCRLLPRDLWQESRRFPVLCSSQLTPGKWVG